MRSGVLLMSHGFCLLEEMDISPRLPAYSTASAERRVLIVAHQFPPAGGVGVMRMLKLCRYLPEHGWRPAVLTGSAHEYGLQDPELLAQCPDLPVYRADVPTSLRVAQRALKAAFGRLGLGWPYRALGFQLRVYDDFKYWLPWAVAGGLRAVRAFRPQAILASGNPFCSFQAATALAALTGLPLVLDYRDGWSWCGYRRRRGALPAWLERRLFEPVCLASAQRVTTTSEPMARSLFAHYPQAEAKTTVICNGYDPADFVGLDTNPEPGGPLSISYVGKFTAFHRPNRFLRGLRLALDRGCPPVRVTMAGGLDAGSEQAVRELGLENVVRLTPFLPHRQALAHLRADVLLSVLDYGPSHRDPIPGKLLEYVAARRPVLAVVPADSPASGIVRDLGLGRVVDPEDGEAIAAAITELATEKQAHGRLSEPPRSPLAERYSRPFQAGQFAAVLEEALAVKAGGALGCSTRVGARS